MSDVLVIPMVDDLSKPIILANSLREKEYKHRNIFK